jgi:tetratricopeptide (TPR) repeat protein
MGSSTVQLAITLVAVGLVFFFIRREIRKGLAKLTERLGDDVKKFLESTASDVKPTIREGFETAGNILAVTFSDTVRKTFVPLITSAIDDAARHIKDAASRLKPTDTTKESPEVAAEVQAFVDSRDYQGLVSHIESISDKSERASYYKEFLKISMSKQDRFSSISAAHKYKELEGDDSPEGYRVLGYVYGWFGDFDTAITHTEHALRLVSVWPDGDAKHLVLGKIYNALAYYYAEKGINKTEAFSYIAKCFEEPFVRVERKAADIDTRGFVSLRFGSSEDEIDSAIRDFNEVLKMEPDNRLPVEHLIEAYKKKKELEEKNKRA